MKETLTVKERLLLAEALPEKGPIALMRVRRELRESLSLSAEELAHWNVRIDEKKNETRWDHCEMETDPETGARKPRLVEGPEGLEQVPIPQEADIEIGEKALDLIESALRNADAAGELTEDYIPLYERFVEAAEK